MNSTVAEDMLPYCDSTSREAAAMPRGRPSASSTDVRTRGPPGWMAQEPTAAGVRPWDASQASSQGRRLAAINLGTLAESVMSKPWLPIVHVIAYSESGNRHEPLALARQASG